MHGDLLSCNRARVCVGGGGCASLSDASTGPRRRIYGARRHEYHTLKQGRHAIVKECGAPRGAKRCHSVSSVPSQKLTRGATPRPTVWSAMSGNTRDLKMREGPHTALRFDLP